jgi:hypothetical protein
MEHPHECVQQVQSALHPILCKCRWCIQECSDVCHVQPLRLVVQLHIMWPVLQSSCPLFALKLAAVLSMPFITALLTR